MSTKLNAPSPCLQKKVHNLHQSPKGAVTPERLRTLDGASGEATDAGGHLPRQGRDGSRAQRKNQLCPSTLLPEPGEIHSQLFAKHVWMKSLPTLPKHIQSHYDFRITSLHLRHICWSYLRMRTGFPVPPLMPITKPGSLTSLTALNTKKMRLQSSHPLLARPAKGKGRKP